MIADLHRVQRGREQALEEHANGQREGCAPQDEYLDQQLDAQSGE